MPVLTDEMVELAEKEITQEERDVFEADFGIDRVVNEIQGKSHTLSVSLFFKPTYASEQETPSASEELLRFPERFGAEVRYNPWNHYVEPILKHSERLIRTYPNLKVRVYLGNDLQFLIPRLLPHCEVIVMRSSSIRCAPGMLWRFLAIEDSEMTTLLDADLLSLADSRIRLTEQLRNAGVGAWRIPVPRDYHRHYGILYRPIAGYASGTANRLPMRILLSAMLWHYRRKTIANHVLFPLNGNPIPLSSGIWPDYGFDEYFLLAAVYPRWAREGLLTILPITPKPPRSFILFLDIEYAAWSHPNSSIDCKLFDSISQHPTSGTHNTKQKPRPPIFGKTKKQHVPKAPSPTAIIERTGLNLAVITCHFNPAGYENPRRNLYRFLRESKGLGVPVFVAELAYDDANWCLQPSSNVLRLRTSRQNTMWHKENLLNLVEKIVPEEFNALAWIDADIWFQRPDWLKATTDGLKRHGVVQLFEKMVLTGRDGRPKHIASGAGYAGKLNMKRTNPGFAWAARRSLWRNAGGLYERAVIGGGDMVNAAAFLGTPTSELDWLNYSGIETRVNELRAWCDSEGGCGGISGVAYHHWHGDRAQRRYVERHEMMKSLDVETQLFRREDGLLEFAASVPIRLRSQIQNYFATRAEDGPQRVISSNDGRRLHFGCGPIRLEGWENLDRASVDLCKPLPFEDGSAGFIFLEHVIEHVGIHDSYRFFKECARILRSGGVVRLAFPSIPKIWASSSDAYLSYQKKMGWGDGTKESGVKATLFEHEHQTAWTSELMIAILESLGFRAYVREIGMSDYEALQGVERHGKDNPLAWESTKAQTVCVEAVKR